MLQDVKSYIGKCFATKDLGEAAYVLGIKIYRDRSSVPMQDKPKLCKSQGALTPAEVKRMQRVPYALVIGSIMYAKSTKQSILATSSAKAEYIAVSDASKEAV
ncbi:hypothetical protein Tco_1193337 [Tanacetum coccineum]